MKNVESTLGSDRLQLVYCTILFLPLALLCTQYLTVVACLPNIQDLDHSLTEITWLSQIWYCA